MITRRNFLINSSILATGTMLGVKAMALNGFNKNTIGLQLYSLRDEIPVSLEAVFKKIAAAGYNSVEMYGFNSKENFFKKSPKEIAALLKNNNLITPSGHYQLELFENNASQTIEAALCLGHKYIVIPWLPESVRKTKDDYKVIAEKVNKAALLCKQQNIKLAYHNHDFEFNKFEDGSCGFEVLINDTDKTLVNFELDLFWVVSAGLNPIDLFKQHPGRFKMWHVKDMDKTHSKLNTEIGTGSIDFKPIFANAKLSGLEYFYVEQENFSMPSSESIAKSIAFVKKNLLK